MATDIVQGLFGLTPEAYQAEQNRQAQAEALRFAQLDPFQQANYGLYMGGRQLGGLVGQALGAQDPQLQKISAVQSLAQNFNFGTVEGLKQAASAIKMYPDVSMALYERAKNLAESESQVALRDAQAKKAMTSKEASTASERNRTFISDLEVKLANKQELTPTQLAQARWMLAQETKPKVFQDKDTGELITIEPLNVAQAAPNLFKMLSAQPAMAAAPVAEAPTEAAPIPVEGEVGTSKTITTPGGAKVTTTKINEGKGLDPSTKKEVGNIDLNLTKLDQSVEKLGNLQTSIDSLDVGLVQNILRSGASALGVNTQDRLAFDQLKREVLKESNNLLLLAKGTQTEGDAQRAKDAIADDNTWRNKDALKAAFKELKDTHSATIEALKVQRNTLTSKNPSQTPTNPPAPPKTPKATSTGDKEAIIQRVMSDPRNKGRSRADVEAALKQRGLIN